MSLKPPNTDSPLNDEPGLVVLDEAQARSLAMRCLQAVGMSGSDATVTAAHLIDASLSGYEFTGLSKLLSIAEEVRRRPGAQPLQVVRETPVSAVIDGGGTIGYVVLDHATDLALAKAESSGIALIAVRNTYLSGRGAHYLERICRVGL